jgi:hypothetical protein
VASLPALISTRGANQGTKLTCCNGDTYSKEFGSTVSSILPGVLNHGVKRGYSGVSSDVDETRARQVEVQLIRSGSPKDVILVFEGCPVWLLALEPSKMKNIYIINFSSYKQMISTLQSQGHSIVLIERAFRCFGIKRVLFGLIDNVSKSALLLASGSLVYNDSLVASRCNAGHHRVLGVVDHHFHGRLRNG